ncbi:MAG TPA: uroporphyrinogen-III synthase [Acidimicrobiales bacterium]|nr:uroporphyrinogen-III synthase [Acidimicrobiales bacterium]
MDSEGLALSGRVIGITADRRWAEQARLFEGRGATVIHAPTFRTVELAEDPALRLATDAVIARPPSTLVVTTGAGLSGWLEVAASWGLGAALAQALAGASVLARGAKSASTARRAGLDVVWRAPHETFDEVIDRLSADPPTGGLAVQLFDPDDAERIGRLARLADPVILVPVYRWRPPVDPGPVRALIRAALAGRLDAVTFTSQPAVHHLFSAADDEAAADALAAAFNGPVLAACVGPVCASALAAHGVRGGCWPEPSRLPAMVRMVAERLGPRPA